MENIIFLVSQPRAGSTLLQKIMAQHHKIITAGEPWILLPFLHEFDLNKVITRKANYDSDLCRRAVVDFTNKYEDFDNVFKKSASLLFKEIYASFPGMSEGTFFLDKTPRYYYILGLIEELFPNSKQIILVRNPIAVLFSILTSWIKKDYFKLFFFKDDLFLAPRILSEKLTNIKSNNIVIYYEEMILEPEKVLKKLFNNLGLEYKSEFLNYNQNNDTQKWKLGDNTNIYKRDRLTNESLDNWKDLLKKPKYWSIANYYLKKMNSDVIDALGYSYNDISGLIEENKPHFFKRIFIFPEIYFASFLSFIGKIQRKKGIILHYIKSKGFFKSLKLYLVNRKNISKKSSFEDFF